MKIGKVWLVGSGPGDSDLLTLKAKKVIEKADVIIYDSLVGQSILSMISKDVKCIDVGKRAGNHTMVQEDINTTILNEAKKGQNVVRLKGGDPFLFGRGGEELELLVKENVEFEIVPGITSAISVPAYNGIPVTHRDFNSSLHIITGHKKKDEEYDIDFKSLVNLKGTMVFLMGVSALSDICKGLLDGGIEPDMPVAILEKGTTSKQRRISGTVATIEEEAKIKRVSTPAIIVVGKVCDLANEFFWYEKLPLSGCRVLVTRPKELVSRLSESLKVKGAEVLEIPAIKIEKIKENDTVKKAIKNIKEYDWIVFTSPSGVKIFFKELVEEKADIRILSNIKIAVIGEGTKRELNERGMFPDLMPEVYDGEALGRELAEVCKDGEKILIPRADIGNKKLVEEILSKKQVTINDVPTYSTLYEKSIIIDEKKEFENGNIDYAIFTSASTVKGFVEITKGLDYSLVNAICIGKQTNEEAMKHGMKTFVSKKATIESLIELTEELNLNKKN